MRKSGLLFIVSLVLAGWSFQTAVSEQSSEGAITKQIIEDINNFLYGIDSLLLPAVTNEVSKNELQGIFLKCRLKYKRFEWVAEYFDPLTARKLNGPNIPEADPVPEAGPNKFRELSPEGLQYIEGMIFSVNTVTGKPQLLSAIKRLHDNCVRFKRRFQYLEMLRWQVFDATRLEIFRMLSLGIAGFDTPVCKNEIPECDAVLAAMQSIMRSYEKMNDYHLLDHELAACRSYLQKNPFINDFNHAEFITNYVNPLCRAFSEFQKGMNVQMVRYNRMLNQDAVTLFDSDAFNRDAFLPGPDYCTTSEKVNLGQKLFSDPILSDSNNRSCASCHIPTLAFTDGLPKNRSLSLHSLSRNTPTLRNAALQPMQFYDLRVTTLEDQAKEVIKNTAEMHGSFQVAVSRILEDRKYRIMFQQAFKDSVLLVDSNKIANALAAYVRSLTSLNSRFDLFMRGDRNALSKDEIAGFNLFMGKAQCATCHYLPLFNGVFPPRYINMDTEVIGVPDSTNLALDKDQGRFDIYPAAFLMNFFKTPTLRNIARTAPYMHNGVFNTLPEVINFYNLGGGKGHKLNITNQTLSSDSLHLSAAEADQLVLFLQSLTDQ